MARDNKMVLNFTIEKGEVEFDVEHGDGTNCETLARVFTDDGEVRDLSRKTEYTQAEGGHRTRRTA